MPVVNFLKCLHPHTFIMIKNLSFAKGSIYLTFSTAQSWLSNIYCESRKNTLQMKMSCGMAEIFWHSGRETVIFIEVY